MLSLILANRICPKKPLGSPRGFLVPSLTKLSEVILMVEPFKGAGEPEVCARVLFAVCKRLYTRYPSSVRTFNQALAHVPPAAYDAGDRTMWALAIASAGHYASQGMKLQQWTTHVIMASRAGYNFRRCFYFDYKAGRDDPRVTNRGVMCSPQASHIQHAIAKEQAKDNNNEQSDCGDCRSGLDNGNTTEGSTLSPKVAKRRLRIARAGK